MASFDDILYEVVLLLRLVFSRSELYVLYFGLCTPLTSFRAPISKVLLTYTVHVSWWSIFPRYSELGLGTSDSSGSRRKQDRKF